jgi:glutamine amidotransferase
MIAIIDYEAGNLTSVKRALDSLEIPNIISADPKQILSADRVIFPGVGHATAAMNALTRRSLDNAIREVFNKGTPLMGICLGTQIILAHSDEGDTTCLGLIPGNCPKFSFSNPTLKVPHMGWNGLTITQKHYCLSDINADEEFYFVHSYYPLPQDNSCIFATCDYEITFPAAIGFKNLFATQFHPEKSGPAGLSILKRFSQWDGSPC